MWEMRGNCVGFPTQYNPTKNILGGGVFFRYPVIDKSIINYNYKIFFFFPFFGKNGEGWCGIPHFFGHFWLCGGCFPQNVEVSKGWGSAIYFQYGKQPSRALKPGELRFFFHIENNSFIVEECETYILQHIG